MDDLRGTRELLSKQLATAIATDPIGALPMIVGLQKDTEEHRQQISRWFYDCGYDIHRGLAEMYLADPRFTKNYEDLAPGLAQWVHDAMLANADRAEH